MRSAIENVNNRNQISGLRMRYGYSPERLKFRSAFNFLIIISIVLYGTNALSENTTNIRGVQIKLGDGNRVCMSFEGEITGIIVKGGINLPGKTFENITRVGNTKISRSHSGMLTRIGHVGIHRDWHGNIVKIGNADILRNKHGSITAVKGDPYVSPLFAIESP